MGCFKNIRIIVLLFVSAFASITEARAQKDSLLIKPEILGADNIKVPVDKDATQVVSASRTAKKVSNLPVTIHVITREEILENGYITLADALKSLPGIKVSQPGNGPMGELFLMRGLGGNEYAKILINDMPVKPSVSDGMPIESQLPVRQAERIEVIYGPASALYGADATVGVINIITKQADKGIFSQADISLGNEQYGYVNFHAGGKAGRNKNILRYSFYGSKMNIDHLDIFQDTALYHPLYYIEQLGVEYDFGGQVLKPTQITEARLNEMGLPDTAVHVNPHYEGRIEMPEINNIPVESQLIGLDLMFRGFSISFQNMARSTHSSIGRSPFLYKYNNPQNQIKDKLDRFTFGYFKQWKRFSSTTNLSFIRYEYDPSSSYGVTFTSEQLPDTYYQYTSSNDVYFEELVNFNYKKLELTAGFTLDAGLDLPLTNYSEKPFDVERFESELLDMQAKDSLEAFGFNPYFYANTALFLQAYYNIGNFYLMAGMRNDFNGLYGERSFNPRGAVLYKFSENFSARLSAGRAYKAPSGNQMYESLAFPNMEDGGIHYAVVPNPDLAPEYFRSYELGFRNKWFKGKLRSDISFFYNYIGNLITSGYVNPEKMGLYQANNYYSEELARTSVNSNGAESKLFGADMNLTLNEIWNDRIRLYFSATITGGQEILPSGEVLQYIRSMPPYTGKAGVRIKPTKRTYINIHSTWVSGWERLFIPPIDRILEENYSEVSGYLVFDMTAGINFHKNLNIWLKVINLSDERYGGIDGTGYDIDLRYNPQLARTMRFGMTFNLN